MAVDDSLAALVERLSPGGRLVAQSNLTGGVDSIAQRIDIEARDGSTLSATVRRSSSDPDAHSYVTPDRFEYEWKALHVARAAGLPAPEPLLLDTAGEYLGVPAIVVRFIEGRPQFPGDDVSGWAARMAAVLAPIHRVTPETHDLSSLNDRGREWMRSHIERQGEWAKGDAFGMEVHAALTATLDTIEFAPPTFTHGDFWSANVVWKDDAVSGVLDWGGAALGDPRRDIASCRVEVVLSSDIEAADMFSEAYERAAGRSPGDLAYFDLYHGLEAYLETDHWMEGAIALGEKVSVEDAHSRIETFLRRALKTL